MHGKELPGGQRMQHRRFWSYAPLLGALCLGACARAVGVDVADGAADAAGVKDTRPRDGTQPTLDAASDQTPPDAAADRLPFDGSPVSPDTAQPLDGGPSDGPSADLAESD